MATAYGSVGKAWSSKYYLVSTSGAIIKNKTAARDGNDWYFYVDKQNIKMYVNNKTLKNNADDTTDLLPTKDTTDGTGKVTKYGLDNWKKW